METALPPRDYPEWRSDPSDRAEDAAYLFGYYLVKHCRDEAMAEVPPGSPPEVRAAVEKAVDTALNNVCDLLEGFWVLNAGPQHTISLTLGVQVEDARSEVVETQQIAPAQLDLQIGYWKWAQDREFSSSSWQPPNPAPQPTADTVRRRGMQFSITTEVDAPPEVVFAVLSEVERWPEWTPTVTRVERLGDAGAPLAVGGRLRIVQPKVPPAEWTITEIEPGRGFRLVSRSPGATVEANHRAEPAGAGQGSRVTLSVTFAGFLGRIIGWMMRGLNERYLAQEAAGLKRRSEERARGT